MSTLLRRLRGALLNGVLWSGAWAIANVGISLLLRLLGTPQAIPFFEAIPSLLVGGAFVGFVAGFGFSLALAAGFRHRELEEIGVASFSLAGAGVAALLVAALWYVPMVLSGMSVPGVVLAANFAGAGILGGSTAFGMIKLAQAAPESLSAPDPILVPQPQTGNGKGEG